jgi:hypothetical protein
LLFAFRENFGGRGGRQHWPGAAFFAGAFYRPLTIPAHFGGTQGPDLGAGGDFQTMRIYGPNGTALAIKPATARRTANGGFTVAEEEAPRQSAPASSLRSISTVDALIALQGVEDPTERKKRAVAKGRNALDVLDALKLGFLDGSVDQRMLARLKVAADGLTDTSGDPALDTVLGEIDLRVAVELAKAGIG